MTISEEDKIESERVTRLINKLENMDAVYVDNQSDILYQKQPFIISMLMGYNCDYKGGYFGDAAPPIPGILTPYGFWSKR